MKFSWLLLLTLSASAFASPRYPWLQRECTPLRQSDQKEIGAACLNYDPELGTEMVRVYYWGYLWENRAEFRFYYSNFAVDGTYFARRPLRPEIYGDDRNLPKREVLVANFIARSHFHSTSTIPQGKPFQAYFQAEEKVAKHNPPFQYDSDLEKNYRGNLKSVVY